MTLDALFETAHAALLDRLAEPATVTPAGGGARIIAAVFSATSQDDLGIRQPMPRITARSDDVADLADGDAVTVRGTAYVARVFAPDGRGLTRIMLEMAP